MRERRSNLSAIITLLLLLLSVALVIVGVRLTMDVIKGLTGLVLVLWLLAAAL